MTICDQFQRNCGKAPQNNDIESALHEGIALAGDLITDSWSGYSWGGSGWRYQVKVCNE